MDKAKLYFQKLKEKLVYRNFFSMRNEESHSARKLMWKITSRVFIVFFNNSAKKGHKTNNLLNSIARSKCIKADRGLRFPCNDFKIG